MERPAILVPPEYYTPDEAIALLAEAAVTLSSRYHFTVQSVLAGTIPTTLARSAKMTDLLDDLGGAAVATLERVDADAVADAVLRARGRTRRRADALSSRRVGGCRRGRRAAWTSGGRTGGRTDSAPLLWRHRSFVLTGRAARAQAALRGLRAGRAVARGDAARADPRVLRGVLALHGGAQRYPAGGALHALFLCAGILPWFVFVEAVTRGGGSLLANEGYLTKLAVPETVFVARSVATSTPTLALYMLALLVMALLSGVRHYQGSCCCCRPCSGCSSASASGRRSSSRSSRCSSRRRADRGHRPAVLVLAPRPSCTTRPRWGRGSAS